MIIFILFGLYFQVLEQFPYVFGDVHLMDFMHAYALGMFQREKEIILPEIVWNDSIILECLFSLYNLTFSCFFLL